MWPNPQFPTDLVTSTKQILNGKLHFLCSEYIFPQRSKMASKFRLHAFFHLHPKNNLKGYPFFRICAFIFEKEAKRLSQFWIKLKKLHCWNSCWFFLEWISACFFAYVLKICNNAVKCRIFSLLLQYYWNL